MSNISILILGNSISNVSFRLHLQPSIHTDIAYVIYRNKMIKLFFFIYSTNDNTLITVYVLDRIKKSFFNGKYQVFIFN